MSWAIAIVIAGWVLWQVLNAWSAYDILFNRPRLRVRAHWATLATGDENERGILVEAVNVGRRPITVTGFCYQVKGEKDYRCPKPDLDNRKLRAADRPPKELKKGQQFRVFIPCIATQRNPWGGIAHYESIRRFYVTDLAGRTWKSQRFPLALGRYRLQKRIQKSAATPTPTTPDEGDLTAARGDGLLSVSDSPPVVRCANGSPPCPPIRPTSPSPTTRR